MVPWLLLYLGVLLTPAALVWVTGLFIAAVRSSTPPLAERPMARTAQFVGAAVASLLVVGPLDVIAWQMIAWQGSVDGSVWTCGVLAVLLIPAAMVWVTPLSADRRIARTAQRVGAATASMAAMVTLVLVGLKMLQPAINLCPSSPCLAVRTIGSGRVPNFPCTSACSPEVILTATPSRGWVFTGWGCYAATWGCTYPWPGSGCAGTGTCTVWVTDDSQYILTATFRRITGGKP